MPIVSTAWRGRRVWRALGHRCRPWRVPGRRGARRAPISPSRARRVGGTRAVRTLVTSRPWDVGDGAVHHPVATSRRPADAATGASAVSASLTRNDHLGPPVCPCCCLSPVVPPLSPPAAFFPGRFGRTSPSSARRAHRRRRVRTNRCGLLCAFRNVLNLTISMVTRVRGTTPVDRKSVV